MQKQRVIVVVTSAVGMLGALLPWMNAPIVGSIPGTALPYGVGWIALGVCCVAILCALGRGVMPVWARLVSGCAGFGALGIAAWQIVVVLRAKAEMRAEGDAISEAMARVVSIGAGLYLFAASALAIIGAVILGDRRLGNTEREPTAESSPHRQLPVAEDLEAGSYRGGPRSGDLGSASAATLGEMSHDASSRRTNGTSPGRFTLCLLIGTVVGAGAVYLATGRHSKSDRGSGSEPCDELEGVRLCVDGVARHDSIRGGKPTNGDADAFRFIHVTISRDERWVVMTVSSSSFELHDSGDKAWKSDSDSKAAATRAGLQVLDYEEVTANTALSRWLTFQVPESAIAVAQLSLKIKHGELRVPLPPIDSCFVKGAMGRCIDSSRCGGTTTAGLCDGGPTTRCCTK